MIPANENKAPDRGEAALREAVILWIASVGLLTVLGAVMGALL